MRKLSLIKDIQDNKLSEDQLIECLDIDHNYVLSNVIRKIVELRISNQLVIKKLVRRGTLLGDENSLMGVYKIGHVALAALYLLDTTESVERYNLEIVKLNEWDKECVEKIKQSDFFL
ncbi:hypothetical protein GCM10008014_53180 [Paenibacillus silvae]|uniref:Uncharacterized protein n=1 Tax=Paenibacillus silvae TaxID=1325358 RepID=A0ABQ1ZN28_9BACL|nr:hypothetical protein [Paenibacillus silvae]GGH69603.1 hypothetical protein GCM10008014_53180 [Paenibacillus silvae]